MALFLTLLRETPFSQRNRKIRSGTTTLGSRLGNLWVLTKERTHSKPLEAASPPFWRRALSWESEWVPARADVPGRADSKFLTV